MNGIITKAKGFFKSCTAKLPGKALVSSAIAAGTVVGMSVPAFASGSGGSVSLPTISITTEMLRPVVEGVIANISAVLPVGLSLFVVFLGVRIVPGLISRFIRV